MDVAGAGAPRGAGAPPTSVQRPCFRMSRHGMTLLCLAVKGAAMEASPGFTMLLACMRRGTGGVTRGIGGVVWVEGHKVAPGQGRSKKRLQWVCDAGLQKRVGGRPGAGGKHPHTLADGHDSLRF